MCRTRSIDIMVLHSITDGIAKMIIHEVISCTQTNSGMRLSDMPTARCLKTVVMTATADERLLTSITETICDHKSIRWPGANVGPDSGRYENQPMSGAMLHKTPRYSAAPAMK